PPLRERGADRFLLVEHLLVKFAQPSTPPSLTARALAALAQYPFPGNVRELSHAIQHAVVVSEGRQIDLPHLPAEIAGADAGDSEQTKQRSLAEAVREFEREYVRRALRATGGHRTKAAQLLGVSRKTLWEKLRGFGLTGADFETSDAEEPPGGERPVH